jgi:membrane protein implicated in regulation of membrane protease activity
MAMTWWLWVALGLVLGAIELATPGGFFVIFFGVAALVVGLAELAGLGLPAWGQWLAFPILAIVALRLFRKPLLARIQPDDRATVDSMVSELAVPVAVIEPGQHGRAELRGTLWNAHNVGGTAVGAGQRTRVVAVNGLQLDIVPE